MRDRWFAVPILALVLGTELMQLGRSKHWQPLIVKIRELYHGKLTYAAHGYQGMRRFAYWDRLDAVGLSLYPSLGQKPDAESIRKRLDHFLGYLTRDVAAPLWILEFGQPSARGSLQKPWDWRRLKHDTATPDMEVQHIALQGWLNAVRDEGVARGRIDRVTLWNWFNDPRAGGQLDNGYTVQNKPAEKMIQCLLNTGCEENRETAD